MIELSYPILTKKPLSYQQNEVNETFEETLKKGKKIGSIQGHYLYQYGTMLGDNIRFAIADRNNDIGFFFVGNIRQLKNHKVLEEYVTWKQDLFLVGEVANIVVNYILPNVGTIVCSEEHTDRGRKLWLRVSELALDKGYKLYYLDWDQTKPIIENLNIEKTLTIWSQENKNKRILITRDTLI